MKAYAAYEKKEWQQQKEERSQGWYAYDEWQVNEELCYEGQD
jgi:hypothetical protein